MVGGIACGDHGAAALVFGGALRQDGARVGCGRRRRGDRSDFGEYGADCGESDVEPERTGE